jgi:Signal transduction histidine kinase
MLLSVGTAALFPLILVIIVSIGFAYRTVSADAYKYANALSESCANSISSRLSSYAGALRCLASAFSAYHQIPPDLRRSIISAELEHFLEGRPELLAAWAQWESGAIGDDPRPYAGSALSTGSGSFNATWYRSAGKIRQGRVSDSAYAGDFYAKPKASLSLELIEPYTYSYEDDGSGAVLESSLCLPILSDGKFLGVVGLDLPLSLFQGLAAGVNIDGAGYAMITSSRGYMIAHPNASLVSARVGDDLESAKAAELLALLAKGESFWFEKGSAYSHSMSRYFFSPIRLEGLAHPWFVGLSAPKRSILAPASSLAFTMAILGLCSCLLLSSAILLATRTIVRPISALSEGAARVASGELSYRVELRSEDEIGQLASSFNSMASELEKVLSGLEARVAERTTSLEKANDGLEAALSDLHAAQEGLELSAKLALIGRLAASVAHELNTPLGAIRSSSEYLLADTPVFSEAQLESYAGLSPADRELFLGLCRNGDEAARRLHEGPHRAELKALIARLEELGVQSPRRIADDISSLGAVGLEGEALRRLAIDCAGLVAEASSSTARTRSIVIMRDACEKAVSAVAALSQYARGPSLESLERLRPSEDIDSLLELYYGKIKRTVKVERSYCEDDAVLGYRDSLRDLWMNLINNALQAMEYKGKLGLSTSRVGRWVRVSISDTGPGIPEENKDKIFTPFFTTKAPGEGTGIGLDICRRIVKRHGGSISFESGRGGAVFTVALEAAGEEGVS